MQPIRLTRRVTFSSGHRYWNPDLSPGENRQRYGTWASPYNHGHNYVLDVTTEGHVDATTGMVVNIKLIDDVLQSQIVAVFDQKSISDEVPAFRTQTTCVENIISYIALQLNDLPSEVHLVGLRLEETPLLFGEWHAATTMKYPITLTRVYEFAASHRLHCESLTDAENVELFGKCNNKSGHGHNYALEVTVGGHPDPVTGMVVDIVALDNAVSALVLERYDHKNLSVDLPEFQDANATSESVALEIVNRLRGRLPAKLVRIRLFETARNMFEVDVNE